MSSKLNHAHYGAHTGLNNVLGIPNEDQIPCSNNIVKGASISQGQDGSKRPLVVMAREVTTDHQRLDVERNQPGAGTLGPGVDDPTTSPNLPNKFDTLHCHCGTEPDSTAAINLGFDGTIHRWTPQSTIKYNVNRYFPRSKLEYTLRCLDKAAAKWNKRDIGVRFERVADHEPAVFQLAYATRHGSWLACSFFPGDEQEARQLCVYEKAFEELYHPWMANLFSHELGHVLGMRHEFAPEGEQRSCVEWGPRNSLSVMNYFGDDLSQMRLQKTDYDELRRFYDYRKKTYRSFTIIDVDPTYISPSLS